MFDNLTGSKDVFGLDIGYNTLKIAELRQTGNTYRIFGYNEVAVPNNCIQKTGIKNKEELTKIIINATKNAKPNSISTKKVCTALPESLVFTKIIKVPYMKKEELDKAIPYEVAEFFPLPLEEMIIDWHIYYKNKKSKDNLEVLVVGAIKSLVKDFIEVTKNAGLELVSLETKPIAASRVLINESQKGVTALVDIGSETSSVSIFDNGELKMTGTVKSGGNVLTNELAKISNIDLLDAEKIKMREGIPLESKTDKTKVILEILRPIVEEISNTIKYYQTRIKNSESFKEIILLGGGGALTNLTTVIEKELKIPTRIAVPWNKIKIRPSEKIHDLEALKYINAFGLAMKKI